MSPLFADSSVEFHEKLISIQSISDADNLYLTNKLTGSKKLDGRIISWFKDMIAWLFKIHLAQTTPLKVAKTVYEFAEKNHRFLTKHDQDVLAHIVRRTEIKGQRYAKGKENAFNAILKDIKGLKILDIPQPIRGSPSSGDTGKHEKKIASQVSTATSDNVSERGNVYEELTGRDRVQNSLNPSILIPFWQRNHRKVVCLVRGTDFSFYCMFAIIVIAYFLLTLSVKYERTNCHST
ncbi:hypothetical protein [Parachlamydia sp. AcF125]|uniref:hypothetical protein n=1 Tax=Parachlamydia sp. AcF125 TaxID=2795736 RepID=UPI001BCA30FC|nr:hypothetical protein [Parachlamydia sp. AcF125]MBS4169254.1 hypothetical protein [Parachlamydia sp. AcF125]